MAQFTIYRSSDASAPQLTNVAGTLITVLNGVLVTGYGSQTGAGWTAPAGLQGTNHWAFLNASPASPTGTGTGFYLDVNDNGPGAGAGTEARICGYETMSGVGTGTGQFPAAAYSEGVGSPYGFVVARKAVSSAVRPWIAFADNLTLYFFAQTDTLVQYAGFAFGDFYSLAGRTDNWRCLLIGRAAENASSYNVGAMDQFSLVGFSATSTGYTGVNTHYAPRTFTGGGTAIALGKHGDFVKNGSTSTSTGGLILGYSSNASNTGVCIPNATDGGYYLSPLWLVEPAAGNATGILRGHMRGLWHICHSYTNFTDGQMFTGTGANYGKTFYVIRQTDGGGCLALETSATLETN
jgi:hypothetical protein